MSIKIIALTDMTFCSPIETPLLITTCEAPHDFEKFPKANKYPAAQTTPSL